MYKNYQFGDLNSAYIMGLYEDYLNDPDSVVVEVPVDMGEGVRTLQDVSLYEQLSLAALLQRHWADNQVSCTVTFDPQTEAQQLPQALNYFQFQVCFL